MSVNPVSNLPVRQHVQGADRRTNLTQPGEDPITPQQAKAPELSATIVTLTRHQPMPPDYQGKTAAPPASHQPMPPDYKGRTAAPPITLQPMPPVHRGNATTSVIPEGKLASEDKSR